MPRVNVGEKLRGDMPDDAKPVGDVAMSLGISKPHLIDLIKEGTIPGWLVMNQFYYCREQDVVNGLKARPVDPQATMGHNNS